MEYEVIRSSRKTFALEVRGDAVIARVPLHAEEKDVERFVCRHSAWIRKQLVKNEEYRKKTAAAEPLSEAERKALVQKAREVIPERAAWYAGLLGVSYGRITIRCQRTKWGSCSDRGNLNFNCLLMLTPPEVIDSVVVHELCHRKEMNHSDRFYREVYRVCPDYDKWNRWLKENGAILMSRIR